MNNVKYKKRSLGGVYSSVYLVMFVYKGTNLYSSTLILVCSCVRSIRVSPLTQFVRYFRKQMILAAMRRDMQWRMTLIKLQLKKVITKTVISRSGPKCTFQFLEGCQGRRTGMGVTTVSNALILGGWVQRL